MVGADRRSTRAAFRIALLVMAIQGLTPDYANLASPWFLRLVTAASVDGRASGDDLSSMPTPRNGSDDGGVAGEICQTVAAESAPRVRRDDDRRLRLPFLLAGLCDRPTRSAPRSLLSPVPVRRWPDGLMPSLCRFLC
jgi:hypothetical protein